jgi:small subunit ribosomal protein S20
MPNSRSSRKRHRKSEKRRLENRRVKRTVRTFVKKFRDGLESPETPVETTEAALREAVSKLDKAAKHNIFHKNAAARQKSRLQLKLNALKAAKAGASS